MSSKLLLSIFTWFSLNAVLHSEQHIFPSITDSFQCYFRVSNLIQKFQTDWVESSNQSSLVIQKFCSIDYTILCRPSCTSFLSQLSSLDRIYFILGVESCSPTFLVAMSTNCRLPSHQSILCILNFSSFLTKCTLLEIWIVCLVYLPSLSIHTSDLLSSIIRRGFYGTIYGSLLKNSQSNILKCAKAIPAVHTELYSLSVLDWATGPETCVPCSIVPPW